MTDPLGTTPLHDDALLCGTDAPALPDASKMTAPATVAATIATAKTHLKTRHLLKGSPSFLR
jgi:hypothetical protein